jgi:hypothetical protein
MIQEILKCYRQSICDNFKPKLQLAGKFIQMT